MKIESICTDILKSTLNEKNNKYISKIKNTNISDIPEKISLNQIPAKCLRAKAFGGLNPESLIDKIRVNFRNLYTQIADNVNFEYVRRFKSDYYYTNVNSFLRDGEQSLRERLQKRDGFKEAEQVIKDAKEIVSEIDKVFGYSRISHPVTVYRGISHKTADRILSSGDIFNDKGLMSTSYLRNKASLFGGSHILEIEVPAGAKVIDMKTALTKSGWEDWEEELLLPRNSKFEVKSVDNDKKIIHLKFLSEQ